MRGVWRSSSNIEFSEDVGALAPNAALNDDLYVQLFFEHYI